MASVVRPYLGAVVIVASMVAIAACTPRSKPEPTKPSMNNIAEQYVRLALAIGQHDPDYVDAYYGPADWKPGEARTPLTEIASRAASLAADLSRVPLPDDELEKLRHEYLTKQLQSMAARVRMLQGERLSFDEESRALYDASARS